MKHEQFVSELIKAAKDLNTAAGAEPLESNHLLTEYGCGVPRSVCSLLTEILRLEQGYEEPKSVEEVLKSLRTRHVIPSVFDFFEQEGMPYKSFMLTYGYCLHFVGESYDVAVSESAFYADPYQSIPCSDLIDRFMSSTAWPIELSLKAVLPTAVVINSLIQLLDSDGCYALGSCIANAPNQFYKFITQRVPVTPYGFKNLLNAPKKSQYPKDILMKYIGDSGVLQIGVDSEFNKLYMAIEFSKGLRTFCVDLEQFGLSWRDKRAVFFGEKEARLAALKYLLVVWLLSFGIVCKNKGETIWFLDRLNPKGVSEGEFYYSSLDDALFPFMIT